MDARWGPHTWGRSFLEGLEHLEPSAELGIIYSTIVASVDKRFRSLVVREERWLLYNALHSQLLGDTALVSRIVHSADACLPAMCTECKLVQEVNEAEYPLSRRVMSWLRVHFPKSDQWHCYCMGVCELCLPKYLETRKMYMGDHIAHTEKERDCSLCRKLLKRKIDA